MAFEVEQVRYPITRTTVVRPVGELSVASISLLRTALRRAVREDAAVIVVDLGRASVRDSAVVVPLVEAARLGRAFGAEVIIAASPEYLQARLTSVGLTDRRRTRVADGPPEPADVAKRRSPGAHHRRGPARPV